MRDFLEKAYFLPLYQNIKDLGRRKNRTKQNKNNNTKKNQTREKNCMNHRKVELERTSEGPS